MAKPNKTVWNFRQKNPRPLTLRSVRPELQAIFDAVQSGEMTPAQGAEAIRALQDSEDRR